PTPSERHEIRLPSGATLALDVSGDGPPLYVIHGGPCGGRTYWRGALTFLEARWRIHAVDLRGHGESSRTPPFTVARLAADLPELAATLGHRDPALLGHSFGATVALQAALDHPQQFSRLVLVGGFARTWRVALATAGLAAKLRMLRNAGAWYTNHRLGRNPDAREALRGVLDEARAILHAPGTPRWVDEHLFAAVTPPFDALEPLTFDLLRWDVTRRLHTLRPPTLLVDGEHDKLAAADQAILASRIPRSQRVVIPGAGHSPFLERPAAFRQAVEGFLDPVRAPAA
ncbi:MAG TPA: alpha/beta hydrolase, partial [Candidatus Thermoplasmatota archaeon]|nr:alpha/beta hydrolase [Candidatus Thermoplasmatota archaeon]